MWPSNQIINFSEIRREGFVYLPGLEVPLSRAPRERIESPPEATTFLAKTGGVNIS